MNLPDLDEEDIRYLRMGISALLEHAGSYAPDELPEFVAERTKLYGLLARLDMALYSNGSNPSKPA